MPRIDARLLVWAMIGLYTAFFSYFTVLRHYTFQTHAYDLGIFMQSFWTTINEGRLLYTTLWEGSRFARHFSPILFFLLPLYAIFPRAETLLIFQSFFLALGAVPIYWIARNEFNSEKAGVISALLYLAYPALHGINRFDFHELALAPIFILFAFHYFKEQKYTNSMIFIIFGLLCREDVPLAIVPMGLYWLWERREQWSRRDIETIFSASVILVGVAWFFLTIFWLIPYFNQGYRYFYIGQYKPEYLFIDLDRKFSYIIELFAPLLYVPLFNSLILIILPALFGQGLFSTNSSRYSINNHHPALLVPFIFLSAIYSIKRGFTLVDDSVKHVLQKELLAPLLAISLILCFFTSPVPRIGMPVITPHHRALKEVISLIPDDASVYTQNDLFPHLAHRSNVYYVVTDKHFFTGWVTPSKTITPWEEHELARFDFILLDDSSSWSTLRRTDRGSLQIILEQYGLFIVVDKIYLFKRDYEGSPLLLPSTFDIFEHGLMARFYNNEELNGTPVFEDRVPNVYFDWGKSSPVRGLIPEDRFSVEFDGYLYIPETGYYDFRLSHDNGARLYLDERLIVDSWERTPSVEEFTLYLKEGFHKFHVDYWENVSNAEIKLSWQPPLKLKMKPIPEEYFYLKQGG
jgi:uncharacterized membrane protein